MRGPKGYIADCMSKLFWGDLNSTITGGIINQRLGLANCAKHVTAKELLQGPIARSGEKLLCHFFLLTTHFFGIRARPTLSGPAPQVETKQQINEINSARSRRAGPGRAESV